MNQVKKESFGECQNHYYSDQEYVLDGVHYLMEQSSGRCYMLVESDSKQAARNGGLARNRVSRAAYDQGLQWLKELLASKKEAEERVMTAAKELQQKKEAPPQVVETALQARQEELRGHALAAMEEHLADAQKFRCLANVREEYHAAQELGNWLVRAGILTLEERKGLVDRVYEVYQERIWADARETAECPPPPANFVHGPEAGAVSRAIYALGLALEKDCPDNDCAVFLNTFHMAQSVDSHAETAEGWARKALQIELARLYRHLKEMFDFNLAVRKHRQALKVRAALEQTPIEPALVRAGLEEVTVQICERLPYLVEKVGDTKQFGAAVLSTPSASALLSSKQRRRLARLAVVEPQARGCVS